MMHFYSFNGDCATVLWAGNTSLWAGCTQYGTRRWSERTKDRVQVLSPLLGPLAVVAAFMLMPILVVFAIAFLVADFWRKKRPHRALLLWPYLLCLLIAIPIV